MRARDIMTRKVLTVSPEAPVRRIARLMVKARVSAVPVVDARRRVLGIVSEGDLLRRRETGTERRRSWWLELLTEPAGRARDYAKARGLKARDVMSRPVVAVTADTDVAAIADLLEKWGIKRVPVLSAGRLAGIVSRRDLVHALASAKPASRRRPSDAAIGEALRREIRKAGWAADAVVNYTVAKGVVEFSGLVTSAATRDALRVLAENVAGVRRVKDRLQIRPSLVYAA